MKQPMLRSFTSEDLVMLPRLDATGGVALGTALISAMKAEGELIEGIAEAAKALRRAHVELSRTTRSRVGRKHQEEDSREAYRTANAVWGAAYRWIDGWSRLSLEATAKSDVARRMRDVLFDRGLEFLQQRFESSWVEADQRLAAIVELDLERAFEELGGTEFLIELRAVHKRYGEVLGLTKARANRPPAPPVRDALDRFSHTMREYVVQVVARAEPESAARLLAPLSEWPSTQRRDRAERSEPPPPVSADDPAPPVSAPPPAPIT